MMADETVHPFQMLRAREAISRGLSHIEQQVVTLETAVHNEPARAFGLSRTLLESTCKRILTERQIPYSENENLPSLFKKVSQNVPFLPPTASQEIAARRSLERTLGGLHSVVQGVSELRNRYSESHGSGDALPGMESIQALLAAGAADVIIGFLHGVHVQDRTVHRADDESLYENNEDFNNHIDENHEICTILDAAFRPSAVLFQMEPETYRLRLSEFKADAETSEDGEL